MSLEQKKTTILCTALPKPPGPASSAATTVIQFHIMASTTKFKIGGGEGVPLCDLLVPFEWSAIIPPSLIHHDEAVPVLL